MAAARSPRSFNPASLVASDMQSEQPPLESDQSTTPTTKSNARLDRSNERQRSSETYCILQSLVNHHLRITYLSTTVAFLRLDDKSWECIQHLRTDAATAAALQPILPQLYQLPNDLALLLEGIREDPDWKNIKDLAMYCLTTGKTPSASRPGPIRSSAFSQRSSLLSNVSTIPSTDENSIRSSIISVASRNSLQHSPGASKPQNQSEEIVSTPASASSPTVSTPPAAPPKDEKEYLCFSRGCGRSYKRFGDLRNHLQIVHPESQQAFAIVPELALRPSPTGTSSNFPKQQPKQQLFSENLTTPNGLPDINNAEMQTPNLPLSPAEMDSFLEPSDYATTSMDNLDPINYFTHSEVEDISYEDGIFAGSNSISSLPMTHQDTIMGGTSNNGPPPVPPSISRKFSNAKFGRKQTRDSRLLE